MELELIFFVVMLELRRGKTASRLIPRGEQTKHQNIRKKEKIKTERILKEKQRKRHEE